MNFALTMIGLASAIIAAAPLFAEVATDPINAANVARIKPFMTRAQVEKILGGEGVEGQGLSKQFPVIWQGRGRNVIIVHFFYTKEGGLATSHIIFFNPSLWDRVKEWWGGYELHPDGSRSKRLEAAT